MNEFCNCFIGNINAFATSPLKITLCQTLNSSSTIKLAIFLLNLAMIGQIVKKW